VHCYFNVLTFIFCAAPGVKAFRGAAEADGKWALECLSKEGCFLRKWTSGGEIVLPGSLPPPRRGKPVGPICQFEGLNRSSDADFVGGAR